MQILAHGDSATCGGRRGLHLNQYQAAFFLSPILPQRADPIPQRTVAVSLKHEAHQRSPLWGIIDAAMGYLEHELKMATDFSEDDLRKGIGRRLGISEFTYHLENKSLDARQKGNIHWLLRVGVLSPEIAEGVPPVLASLSIPSTKVKRKALVVGSGPAGFFSAFVLQKGGIDTTLVERGAEVNTRSRGIKEFEKTGIFNTVSNYAFGEGGAGTFSDGKLTSRTKHISKERHFILSAYVDAGGPEEILYMAHPHLGSDNLRKIVKKLREQFLALGGTVMFETPVSDLTIRNGRVLEATVPSGSVEADVFVVAPGHSSYETYRMLMAKGVMFRTKAFAIGARVEHPQALINKAQWGKETLPGVKAADYRLTSKGDTVHPVYTFCMCPGGIVVPATAYAHTNVVNGMSRYGRGGHFANAGCVAGLSLGKLLGREVEAREALDWLEALESSFHRFSAGYGAPACTIREFINRGTPSAAMASSYPLGLKAAPLWELFPSPISNALREGLKDFRHKINGFEEGTIMGLESKTSSPIQVLREKNGCCTGFENLYVVGEGSGYAGGIISSGADGIKAAIDILVTCQ
jgi:uncharacterized protein